MYTIIYLIRLVNKTHMFYLESNLSNLRAQQKLKVEELKKKTSYYTTKSLLDRYDQTSKPKAKPALPPAQPNSSNRAHERNPQCEYISY
jgi:hypothetical protein